MATKAEIGGLSALIFSLYMAHQINCNESCQHKRASCHKLRLGESGDAANAVTAGAAAAHAGAKTNQKSSYYGH